jgi:hypothetical protein
MLRSRKLETRCKILSTTSIIWQDEQRIFELVKLAVGEEADYGFCPRLRCLVEFKQVLGDIFG